MTKAGKRLERLFAKRSPKDFSWDEAMTVLKSAGFQIACHGGSHHECYHELTGFTFQLSMPHKPGRTKTLKPYQIKALIRALEAVGATPNANDEISRVHGLN